MPENRLPDNGVAGFVWACVLGGLFGGGQGETELG